MNFVQFNVYFGCPFCLSPGETTAASKGHSHTYIFDRGNLNNKKLRDHASTQAFAKEAVRTKKSVYGVKGHSWLLYLPNFDLS